MRENNPLKPGTPAFSPAIRGKMLKILPILSVIISISLVTGQYSRKAKLEADLVVADKQEKVLDARYKELRKANPVSAGISKVEPEHHDDH